MFYEVCEYCPISGSVREKGLPFGDKDGKILVVVPNYVRLSDGEKLSLELACPEAYFVFYAACANVEDIDKAEVVCGVLLRNEARKFRKLLVYDSQAIKSLFHIASDSVERNDGVKFSTYKGRIGDNAFKEEYKRLRDA